MMTLCVVLGFFSMYTLWMLLRAFKREELMTEMLGDMMDRAEEHIESWHPEWLGAEDENHAQTN